MGRVMSGSGEAWITHLKLDAAVWTREDMLPQVGSGGVAVC